MRTHTVSTVNRFLPALFVALLTVCVAQAAEKPKRLLFFTKSSGFEHSVISWKNGRPSHAEKVLLQIGESRHWTFDFSKDGSLFSPAYLSQYDAVFFYTTGNLLVSGTDGFPALTPAGKQALFDYVRSGKGFIGTHATTDTFHTGNEDKKGPDRYVNHGAEADPFVHFIGGEFIKHGNQQKALNRIIDPKFPGYGNLGDGFTLHEEWYSLKDFASDIHVLTVIDSPSMSGVEYARPPYPTGWARMEGKGRVWYTAMGHREDIWTNPIFQQILVGGIEWALGGAKADLSPNLKVAAPGAQQNPSYPAAVK